MAPQFCRCQLQWQLPTDPRSIHLPISHRHFSLHPPSVIYSSIIHP